MHSPICWWSFTMKSSMTFNRDTFRVHIKSFRIRSLHWSPGVSVSLLYPWNLEVFCSLLRIITYSSFFNHTGYTGDPSFNPGHSSLTFFRINFHQRLFILIDFCLPYCVPSSLRVQWPPYVPFRPVRKHPYNMLSQVSFDRCDQKHQVRRGSHFTLVMDLT